MKVGKERRVYKACEERNRQVVKLNASLKFEHLYWGISSDLGEFKELLRDKYFPKHDL